MRRNFVAASNGHLMELQSPDKGLACMHAQHRQVGTIDVHLQKQE